MKKFSSCLIIFYILFSILSSLFILSGFIYTCIAHNNITYDDFVIISIFITLSIVEIPCYIALQKFDYKTLFINENEVTLKGKNCISISIKDIDRIEYDNTLFTRLAFLGIVKIYTYTKNEYSVLLPIHHKGFKKALKALNNLLTTHN